MVKSILVDDNVHERILNTQEIIRKKYKARISLSSIVDKMFDNPEKIANMLFEK